MDKIKKNNRIKGADVLSESKFFSDQDMTPTSVPMINVALSGDLNGGLTSGLTVIAGDSKHFKTSFALLMASDYMKKYSDAVLIFYDTEFGSPQAYFDNFGIDTSRVWHVPVQNVEELKFDIINQLEQADRKDHIIIIIDSIGNIASKKELDDAMSQKSVADMSRAKALKGLFRMTTPYLATKDIPMIAINHIYREMGLFPKAIVSGGTGIYYSADNIWIVGRQQNKDSKGIKGYHFVIGIEKSRYVKEKSKIPISVTWEEGVKKYSGLLEVAVAGKFVHKGKKGQSLGYAKMNNETGEVEEEIYYEKDTDNGEFWQEILDNPGFKDFVQNQYQMGKASLVDFDEIVKSDVEVE